MDQMGNTAALREALDRAVAAYKEGRAADAETICRTILAEKPDFFDALHLLAVIQSTVGQWNAALLSYDRALTARPDHAGALYNRGVTLQNLQRFEEALASYERAIASQPNNARALTNRGVALQNLGRFEEALASYERALVLRPDDLEALNNRGVALQELGRFEEALASHEQLLAARPDYPDALTNRGIALQNLGRLEEALASFERALALRTDDSKALNNRGVTLQKLKRFEEALATYDRLLAMCQDNAEAHYNRGVSLQELRRFEEALASYDKALTVRANYVEALNNRGVTLQKLERFEQALASYERVLVLRPNQHEGLSNRGVVLGQLGRFDEALTSYDRVLAIRPDDPETFYNRGVALQKLGRFNEALASYDGALTLRPNYGQALANRGVALHELKRYEDALSSYDRLLALEPSSSNTLNNRGNTLRELRRLEDSLRAYEEALLINPHFVEALSNCGGVLHELGRFNEALASYERALALCPHYPEALYSRGVTYKKLRRLEEARESFEQALALKPDLKFALDALADCAIKLCDWGLADRLYGKLNKVVGEQKTRGTEGVQLVSPFLYLGYCGDASMQPRCAQNYIQDRIPALPKPLWRDAIWRNERIKIAYLSADFREDPTAQLAVDLFQQHDRSRFEVIGLSYGPDDGSEMRARLINAVDQFHDVRSVSDREVAHLVSRMQTDIVIDLTGYTEYCRPEILSYRPAPISVLFLGYPGTVGASFIDYVLADKVVLPFDQQPFFAENIVHLPDCYQINSRRDAAAETPKRRAAGLPEEGIVFCCFNNLYKVTRGIFEVWMRLLGQVDGSVLWLMSTSEATSDRLRGEAMKRGINPARLVFAERQPLGQHLARHRLADLFLDTLPYNAHTTASDALWAGVPVLTCYGTSFQGRVAASVLNAVGLPELVTADPEEYKALALRLATRPLLLADLKARLEHNRLVFPLFDVDRFRRHIESAYATMWDLWQHGERPRSFSIEPSNL